MVKDIGADGWLYSATGILRGEMVKDIGADILLYSATGILRR